MDMKGRHVLVTGTASGIGRATALRFAARGAATVACVDIHAEGNRETAAMVERAGARALAVQMDLASVPDIRRGYAEVAAAFGRIDAAAHVGGYSWRGNTLDVTEEQWEAVIGVNLRGCFFCCQQALRIMYAQGAGAIVNMSADAAFHPMEGFALQAAGKGGLVNMTRTLALESARRGVRVNAVSPGIVDVRRTGADPAHGVDPERTKPLAPPQGDFRDWMADQTAPGRWVGADEVADTIVFLCSDAASGINGDLLFINGGGYFSFRY
ncbi:MAG: SDR family NAD(P)-dependent oxidoreductase [Gammaproteobacteria bacterium]